MSRLLVFPWSTSTLSPFYPFTSLVFDYSHEKKYPNLLPEGVWILKATAKIYTSSQHTDKLTDVWIDRWICPA